MGSGGATRTQASALQLKTLLFRVPSGCQKILSLQNDVPQLPACCRGRGTASDGLQCICKHQQTHALSACARCRWGTASAPLVIQAEGGPGKCTLSGYVALQDVRYLYIVGVRFANSQGRVMQVRWC